MYSKFCPEYPTGIKHYLQKPTGIQHMTTFLFFKRKFLSAHINSASNGKYSGPSMKGVGEQNRETVV